MCISMLAVKWAVFVAWHLFDMFRTPELQPWIELGSVWNQRLNMMQWQKKSLLVQITLTVLWAWFISTLLSVFEVEGLPERGSSLMDSRPSENALYHLNTCDLDKACSPYACFSLLKVSKPVSPSLTQNLIAHRCSILRSSISVTHAHNTASQETALKLGCWS